MRRFRRSATDNGRRPDISGGDRAVLSVLAHHGEHEGCTVLEATYLLSEWRFPMERSATEVEVCLIELTRVGLAEVNHPLVDLSEFGAPPGVAHYLITPAGRDLLR